MQRVTITLDDELMAQLDAFTTAGGYASRSEAMRDLARAGLLHRADPPAGTADCVAALVYVYDHESRQLPRRLAETFHDHHAMTVSTMHVHLDRHECMELTVLRGPADAVRRFGDSVVAEKGVRHGRLLVVPAADDQASERGP